MDCSLLNVDVEVDYLYPFNFNRIDQTMSDIMLYVVPSDGEGNVPAYSLCIGTITMPLALLHSLCHSATSFTNTLLLQYHTNLPGVNLRSLPLSFSCRSSHIVPSVEPEIPPPSHASSIIPQDHTNLIITVFLDQILHLSDSLLNKSANHIYLKCVLKGYPVSCFSCNSSSFLIFNSRSRAKMS